MTGVGVALIGLLLCFAGRASIHLALLASGFALGWVLASALGGSLGVAAVVGLCAAVVTWVLATLVFRAALFVIGAVAGAVIGSRVFELLQGDHSSPLLAILFAVAVGVLTGLAVQRFRETAVIWACALGGAGLALSGAALIWPDRLGFLRTPDSTAGAVVSTAAWILLGVAGWSVQRRLGRRRTRTAG